MFNGRVFTDGQILPPGVDDEPILPGAADVVLNPLDQIVDGNRSGNQQQWFKGRVRIVVEVVETLIKWTRVMPCLSPSSPERLPKPFQFGCAHGPPEPNQVGRHDRILPWCRNMARRDRATELPQGLRHTQYGSM
jgi:hypothetical protein